MVFALYKIWYNRTILQRLWETVVFVALGKEYLRGNKMNYQDKAGYLLKIKSTNLNEKWKNNN